MKFNTWVGLFALVASVDACRGSYIGAEDCNGAGSTSGGSDTAGAGEPSCPVCPVCTSCKVCAEDREPDAGAGGGGAVVSSAGAGNFTSGGFSGAPGDGGKPSASGAAGQAGSSGVDACALKDRLPNPSFYVSFDDCDETTSTIEGKFGRLPYSASLTAVIGEKDNVFDNSDLPCVEGKYGLAMQFGAGRVRFLGNPNVDLDYDATISVWVRQDVEHAGPNTASAFGRWYNDDQYGLGVLGTTWTFTAAFTANEGPFKVSADIELGSWTQLVVVARRGASLEFYKDGVRVPQATPVTLPPGFAFQPTIADLSIGQLFDESWEPYFEGALDDLRIYKTAFSDIEVAALHCD